MGLKKQLTIVSVVFLAWYWQKYIFRGPVFTNVKNLKGRTVLITGGNAGIGKAAALEFAKMGARVVIASRKLKKSEKARDEIIEESENENVASYALDLGDFGSVRSFAKLFLEREENLDILVNNAGVFSLKGKTADGYNRVSVINHFGPFLLTNLLMDRMKAHSKKRPVRIINVSSEGYQLSPSKLDFDMFKSESSSLLEDFQVYGNSKLANILFTAHLHTRVAPYDITTYTVHPGAIRTEFGDNFSGWDKLLYMVVMLFSRSAYYGAQTILYCALDDDVVKHSGDYFYNCARQELYPYAKDEGMAKKLWQESVKVTKLD